MIGWSLGTRNREVFQGVDQQWYMIEVMILKRSSLRQLMLFFFFYTCLLLFIVAESNNFYLLLFVRSSLLHTYDISSHLSIKH